MPRNVKPSVTDMTLEEKQLLMKMSVASRLSQYYEEMAKQFNRETATATEQFWMKVQTNRIEIIQEIKRKMHVEDATCIINLRDAYTKVEIAPDWRQVGKCIISRTKKV